MTCNKAVLDKEVTRTYRTVISKLLVLLVDESRPSHIYNTLGTRTVLAHTTIILGLY